ncbi:28S ribosomal protein S24, mitochondrial-like [Oppia nitens]|uniref:28S ribosomal protein S24, mitochondrial-like n=1 Tax=Oppia nitens TaxID=1686743 RepID=UPI0023DA8FFC|nr:28S ribosomal protein S24, mitochondrial-like [Oppia nitens]
MNSVVGQRVLFTDIRTLVHQWQRCIHTSHVHCKQVAARYTRSKTRNKTFPMTYEMVNPPHYIAVRKGWNSWNTSSLVGIGRTNTSQTTVEDLFIRKFIFGTFHRLFLSEIIIKRRANIIIVSGIVHQSVVQTKMYFLIGYSEQILSYQLKCIVKMDIQITHDSKALVVKYI